MVDVDGVLVEGRPEDGLHWQTSLERDLSVTPDALQRQFFAPFWDDIIVGRAGLLERLRLALPEIAPGMSPDDFVAYWFERDSRLSEALLRELSVIRAAGIRVYLATNQEHLRAAHLMEKLGLAERVDGIFYSALLGEKKPSPAFFSAVRESVGLRADEILLVDDSRANIEAAEAMGWRTLHWPGPTSLPLLRDACGL